MTLTISKETRRRYILGQQGLWPGRRWAGLTGLAKCLEFVQAIQIDPVAVLSQSHDLALWGRVLDYDPDLLGEAMYAQRKFFDYGGALYIYPMSELPYWRLGMERMKEAERWHEFASEHPEAIELVRDTLRKQGPVRKRDVGGDQIEHYRGSKVSGVALYYLWLTGDLMTHHREGKERVYGFRDEIAPQEFNYSATTMEAEEFFAIKTTRLLSLFNVRLFRNGWKGFLGRQVEAEQARQIIDELVERDLIARVSVEAERGDFYIPIENKSVMDDLGAGKTPKDWKTLGPTTLDEVVFLSPLEYVSARGRAKNLFDFDFIWEIYKPAEKRRFGPYTLPILYGDQLVGRMDAKNNRQELTLKVNGLWIEDGFEPGKPFFDALGAGLGRLTSFLGTEKIDIKAIRPQALRKQVENAIKS